VFMKSKPQSPRREPGPSTDGTHLYRVDERVVYATYAVCEQGGLSPNQDYFGIETHPQDPSLLVCAVADGQGGAIGGAEAAKTACSVTLDGALARAPGELAKPATWLDLVRAADEAVKSSPQAGRTTLVALCIAGSVVTGASSGDSAAIAVIDGVLHELTSNQRKDPPVGSGFADFVPFVSSLAEPWKVCVVSDGAWARCGRDNALGQLAADDVPNAVEQLQSANRSDSTGDLQDDFTVLVVQSQPS